MHAAGYRLGVDTWQAYFFSENLIHDIVVVVLEVSLKNRATQERGQLIIIADRVPYVVRGHLLIVGFNIHIRQIEIFKEFVEESSAPVGAH